jgi:RNA recognition motif-containing protein
LGAAQQNTKDRFYGTSDPVANKILGRKRRQEEIQERREEGAGFDRAPCTLYLRLQGDPPYPALTERDVRDQFYAFGEIVSVRIQPGQGQGFVEYTSPEATELAISSMNRKEVLGRALFCSWARAPKRGEASAAGGGGSASAGDRGAGAGAAPGTAPGTAPAAVVRPRPPPGAGGASSSLPALPAVKLPPEVAAMAAARKQRLMEGSGGAPAGGPAASSTLLRPPRGTLTSVPRPSGAASYPSTDPQRLGSKAAASASDQ